jgi:hypothetical protein
MKSAFARATAIAAALITGCSLAASAAPAAQKPTAPPAPSELTGIWSGLVAQVGRSKQYTVTLKLSGKTGQSSYPEQHCTGKLTRAGSSGDYAFFVETITEGKFDATTKSGCIDGSMTLVRAGDALVMGWTAAYGGRPIIAYGSLAPQKE